MFAEIRREEVTAYPVYRMVPAKVPNRFTFELSNELIERIQKCDQERAAIQLLLKEYFETYPEFEF